MEPVSPDAQLPTVLVVEDNPLVLITTVDLVESAGYRALEASNADEAIAILESHPEIHLLFTDIEMPGRMDGIKLAHYARKRWPPLKIIVVSGQSTPDLASLPKDGVFLPKPFYPAQVAAALARMLRTDA